MTVSSAKTGAVGLSLALDNNYMEPIATTLVGSGGTNSIIFNDIPQTYKHLQLRILGKSTTTTGSGGDDIFMQFNSDIGNNYTRHRILADGSTSTSSVLTSQSRIGLTASAARENTSGLFPAIAVVDILDYTNINKNKVIRSLNGGDYNGVGELSFISGLWINTNPITSIRFTPEQNLFAQYSRFSLYGIKG